MKKVKYNGTTAISGGEFLEHDSNSRTVKIANDSTPLEMVAGFAIGTVDSEGYLLIDEGKYYPANVGAIGVKMSIDSNGKRTQYTNGIAIGYCQDNWTRLFI